MIQQQFNPGTTGFLVVCLAGYLLLVNLLSFTALALDRRRARQGDGRVPKRAMVLLVSLGGWPGTWLAQLSLRHRVGKRSFAWLLNICALILPAGLAVAVVAHDPEPVLRLASGLTGHTLTANPEPTVPEIVMPRRFGPGSDVEMGDLRQD